MGQLASDSFTALHRVVHQPGSHSRHVTDHGFCQACCDLARVDGHSPDTVAYQAITDLSISQPEIPSG